MPDLFSAMIVLRIKRTFFDYVHAFDLSSLVKTVRLSYRVVIENEI